MFTTTLPTSAAVYCRVSSEAQQERQTIETQVEFARKYCDLNNIEITEIYRDDGVTGTLPLQERPAGAQLLADAQAGHFQLVLIFKLDRLGRSTRVILNAVHDLDNLGAKVKSMTEPFDTSDASGRFLLTVLAGVADLERSNILQRMDMGATRAAREGKWLGGIVPYGYLKNDDGFLAVNDAPIPGFDLSEPDVVRMVFDMCVNDGATSIQIADHLNALGIPPAWVAHNLGGKRRNRTRGTWGSSRILRILKSTTYMGIHEYGKRSTKDTITRPVPPIVDVEIWQRAQTVIKNNQIDAIRNAKHKYLLKSIVKCESCGATYRGNPAGRKSTGGYYSCGGRSNWRRMGRTEKCQAMSVSMTWLDDFVWQDCLKFINNPGLVVAAVDDSEAEREADVQTESLLENRLAELDADRERMLDLYRQKLISLDDLSGQLDKIKKDREVAQAELDALRDKHDADQFFAAKETAVNMLELLKETVNKPDISFEMKQTVIRTMVDKITVRTLEGGAKAQVTIHYRFHDETPADFTRTVSRKGNHADYSAGITITTVAEYPPAPEPGNTQRERLIYLRWRENLTQSELAAIGSTTSASIGGVETGKYSSLQPATIRAICDHFKLPYWFLGAYDRLPEETIPQQLYKYRMYRLFDMYKAAAFFDVDRRTYFRWEHGHISKAPNAKKIQPEKLEKWKSHPFQPSGGSAIGRLVLPTPAADLTVLPVTADRLGR